MVVVSKFIACDRQADLCVIVYMPIFCELRSYYYMTKRRIRLIEKALDVGSHRTFELFHKLVIVV